MRLIKNLLLALAVLMSAAASFAPNAAEAAPAYYSPFTNIASIQALAGTSPSVMRVHVQSTNQNYTWNATSTATPTADNAVVQATGITTGRWIVDPTTAPAMALSSISQASPLLALNNFGNVGNTANLLEHDPSAVDPNAGKFSLKMDSNIGDNLPDSPIADTVWYLGYNIDAHGTRADPTKAALSLHWESFYIRNPSTPGDPPTQEWHLQFEGTDGVTHRPLSYLLDIAGTANHALMDMSDLSLFDWGSGSAGSRQRVKFSFPIGSATSIELYKETQILFDVNGTSTVLQMNAAHTAYLALPYYDTFNVMHMDNAVIFGSTMTYGGTAIAASTTGSGGLVLATSPTLITPNLGVAAATNLAISTLTTNPSSPLTSGTFAPGITMTSGNNSQTTPTLGAFIGPYVNSNNTGNYTGSVGPTGVFINPVILSGATGSLAAWHGAIIELDNASAAMSVTRAFGLQVNNFTSAGGVNTYAIGSYLKDQSNGTNNTALLIGGAGDPSIAGNWSFYDQSTLASLFAGPLTLNGAVTYGGVTLSNAVTGTGSMVLSASPTFTGTLSASAATLSGALTYGGVALATSVTGTGSMVLSASPTFTGTLSASAATLSGALTYGGVTLSNSVTGTGSMALSASPTFTGTLTAPTIVATLALTASQAFPDGTTAANPNVFSPTLIETTATNSSTTPLRGLTVNSTILGGNTQSYTGANGVQGVSINTQFQVGATGTVANVADLTISMTNATVTTPLVVTNAAGVLVNLFTGTNGYNYINGIYTKDQAGGTLGNISLLVGGSAAAPNISGTFSVFVAGVNPVKILPTVTLTGLTTDSGHTTRAVCQDTTSGLLLFGSGTLGVCLGTSSGRFKHDVHAVEDGLDAVLRLRPVNFFYDSTHGDNGAHEQYGFIAEDVDTVLPKLVSHDSDGLANSVDIVGMVPVITHAMQQQQTLITAVNDAITGLSSSFMAMVDRQRTQDARIDALADRVTALEHVNDNATSATGTAP